MIRAFRSSRRNRDESDVEENNVMELNLTPPCNQGSLPYRSRERMHRTETRGGLSNPDVIYDFRISYINICDSRIG